MLTSECIEPELDRTRIRILSLILVAATLFAVRAEAQQDRVLIYGVAGEPADNMRAVMGFDRFDCETPRWRLRQAMREAPARARAALRAVGYYAAKIEQRLGFTRDCWRAHFDVEPGEPVVVTSLQIIIEGEADSDPFFKSSLDRLRLSEGDILHHGRYEDSKSALLNLGIESGYFDGQLVESKLTVNPEELKAFIRLRYRSGPRYKFGNVLVTHTILDPDFIARYVDISAGEPYDARRLSSLYQGFADSGYFKSVQIRPEIQQRSGLEVPISVDLDQAPRYTHSFGIGAATDTGPRARYGYVDRRINQRGHRLEASIELSAVGSEFGSEYRIPADDPRTEWFSLTAARKAETTDSVDTQQSVIGVRRTRQLSRWLQTQSLELQHETFEVADDTETTLLLVPGIGWTRTRADDRAFPRRGYTISFEVRGASEAIVSDLSFVQATLRAKRIWPLPLDARLLARVAVGATELDQFSELPASLRFFAGGDNSVRGYAYQSLGPANADGDTIGGRHLLVGSLEVELPWTAQWSVAAFIDEGNAIDHANDDLATGYGIGLRWRSPIGPIRMDLAHPVDDDNTNIRFHLSMGLDL